MLVDIFLVLTILIGTVAVLATGILRTDLAALLAMVLVAVLGGIAANSVASPVAQPAHALVMAPAGYRMRDYVRLGLPVTLVILALTILVTPFVLPF